MIYKIKKRKVYTVACSRRLDRGDSTKRCGGGRVGVRARESGQHDLLKTNLTRQNKSPSVADTGFFFFLQNTSWIRKPQVISRGGGTHPLHPPPRSAPVLSLCLFFSLLFSRSLPSRRTPLSERLEQSIYTEETMGRTRDFYPPLSKAPWSLRLLRRRVNKKSEKRNVIRRQGFFGYDAMCNNGFAPFLL